MTVRASMFGVILFAVTMLGAWASAQVRPTPVDPPIVLSGNDVGFRIEGRRGGTPVGTMVVRIDGRWVEVQFTSGVQRPATN